MVRAVVGSPPDLDEVVLGLCCPCEKIVESNSVRALAQPLVLCLRLFHRLHHDRLRGLLV
jgi:hypothetical protein